MKPNYLFYALVVQLFLTAMPTNAQIDPQNPGSVLENSDIEPGNDDPARNCEDFDNGIGDWQRSNYATYNFPHDNEVYPPTNTTSGPSGSGTDFALDGFDASGSDILFNQGPMYQGNLRKKGNCLCFDFLVIDDQQNNTSVFPRIVIYQGDMSTNPTRTHIKQAVFTYSTALDESDGWVRICIPLTPGNPFPTSNVGSWQVTIPANPPNPATEFNDIVTNADGIYFVLDVNNNPNPNERYAFDNICFEDCPRQEPDNDGAYCCDASENLIQNGNFESGNTGFSSDYAQNAATLPGQYNVTNSASAFGANITDHSFCADPVAYANNDRFLLVNGLTNQPAGTSSVIYRNTLPSFDPDKEYRFCVNFKNLPQCTFDVLPEVQIEVNGNIIVPYTQINTDPTNPCDWVTLSGCFSATDGAIPQIEIRLKEDGLGDGNDLAIDDISVQVLADPGYSLTVTHNGGPNNITATISPFPLLNERCELQSDHYWFVYQTNNPANPSPPTPPYNNNLPSTFAWSDGSGSYGPGLNNIPGPAWTMPTTNFPNYPPFQDNTFYVIGMYIPSCCEGCYGDDWVYQITYNYSNRPGVPFELSDEIKAKIKALFVKTGPGTTTSLGEDTSFKVYPNPSKGTFNIDATQMQSDKIEVFDLNGSPVYTQEIEGKRLFQVDLQNLSSGIYLLKITTENGQYDFQKLIVK